MSCVQPCTVKTSVGRGSREWKQELFSRRVSGENCCIAPMAKPGVIQLWPRDWDKTVHHERWAMRVVAILTPSEFPVTASLQRTEAWEDLPGTLK